MMRRRRFLTLSAAALATPVMGAAPLRWHGIALGANASFELQGPAEITRSALAAALNAIRRIEALFSLYDPASALSRLNATGRLDRPDAAMLDLFRAAHRVHDLTKGRFDPTVQTIWPEGQNRAAIGWSRVRYNATRIALHDGQSLTFNGIAQGFATDRAADALRVAGLTDIHVNVGEQRTHGPARQLGVEDPVHGLVGNITLRNSAVATSSPLATPAGAQGHILSPFGEVPQWSTVTVMADSATLADGLSTGLCHAPFDTVATVRTTPGVKAILLV
ncbi:MAG: FAD:protein FMN transferase, partial [Pseudomonadota bacterium]